MNKIFYSMFIFALGSKELAMNGKQVTRYETFLSALAWKTVPCLREVGGRFISVYYSSNSGSVFNHRVPFSSFGQQDSAVNRTRSKSRGEQNRNKRTFFMARVASIVLWESRGHRAKKGNG